MATNMQALVALGVPTKLVAIAFFALRYIFIYNEELRKMNIALCLRGDSDELSWQSLQTKAGVVGSLLLRSFANAEKTYAAMVLRGYNLRQVFAADFRTNTQDVAKALLAIMALAAVIYFR